VPQLGYVGPSARALDLAPEIRAPRELHARLANTAKHVQIEVPTHRPDVEALLEIAELAAGADLRERPIVSAVLPITSPLALDGDRLEAAIALAEAGMPCGVVAEPVAGVTAPATPPARSSPPSSRPGRRRVAPAPRAGDAVVLRDARPPPHAAGREPAPDGPSDPLFRMAWVQLARPSVCPLTSRVHDGLAAGLAGRIEGGLSRRRR
jgi:hypothetical protein